MVIAVAVAVAVAVVVAASASLYWLSFLVWAPTPVAAVVTLAEKRRGQTCVHAGRFVCGVHVYRRFGRESRCFVQLYRLPSDQTRLVVELWGCTVL